MLSGMWMLSIYVLIGSNSNFFDRDNRLLLTQRFTGNTVTVAIESCEVTDLQVVVRLFTGR